ALRRCPSKRRRYPNGGAKAAAGALGPPSRTRHGRGRAHPLSSPRFAATAADRGGFRGMPPPAAPWIGRARWVARWGRWGWPIDRRCVGQLTAIPPLRSTPPVHRLWEGLE